MFRPSRFFVPVAIIVSSLALSACKTIYTDVYSPKRNHFKPVSEAPKLDEQLPPEAPPPAGDAPPAPPPSAPVPMPLPDAAPMPDAAPQL
jgi:hypothetical protein